MDQRNRWLHAEIVQQFGAGEWYSISRHLKSGREDPTEKLSRVVEKVDSLVLEGIQLQIGLLREVSPSVYYKAFILRPNEPCCVVNHGQDANFARPTREQFEEWYDTYGVTVLSS